MSKTPKGPLVLELDETPLPPAPTPAEAPPPLDPALSDAIDDANPAGARAIAAAAGRTGWTLGRMMLASAGALVMLWLGVAVTEFVTGLFASYAWLGWVGVALVVVFTVLLVLMGFSMTSTTATSP